MSVKNNDTVYKLCEIFSSHILYFKSDLFYKLCEILYNCMFLRITVHVCHG